MKLAVIVGGWHWPLDFYDAVTLATSGADLFVVAHRSPELPVVRNEKLEILNTATPGPLLDLDKCLYSHSPTVSYLRTIGWDYEERPNTQGDWGFFNQWLEGHNYHKYDLILNCHDDTYLRPGSISVFNQVQDIFTDDWLILSNGTYPEAPEAYVRGSFEFWKPEILDRIGGKIDLGAGVRLDRTGATDSPQGMDALNQWNDIGEPLRQFIIQNGLSPRIKSLSPYYRISKWVIEGERGFMHFKNGVLWSFEKGLQEYPLVPLSLTPPLRQRTLLVKP